MHPRCQLLTGRLPTSRILFQRPIASPRAFTTSAVYQRDPLKPRRGGDLGSHLPKHVIPSDADIPEYPYGESLLFKQSNKGLYGGQIIQFGNNVSHDTETKTRRNWKPNVLSKSLYSVALKKKIKLRVTSRVLKTMDREGGLDEYLLKPSEHRIKELGPTGWALRWTLMQKPEVIARLRAEAAELGIEQEVIDKQWPMRGSQRNTKGPKTISIQQIADEAAAEYKKAEKAAQRYLDRGLVDTVEEGLRLAFVRAKEREEARLLLRQNFNSKLQSISVEAVEEVKTRLNLPADISDKQARRIAYNQQKRAQIEEAGGVEAWKKYNESEKTARFQAQAQEAGGLAKLQANKKEKYAQLIKTAQNAQQNQYLESEQQKYYAEALEKAERAIQAGDKESYIASTVEEAKRQRASLEAERKDTMKPIQSVDEWATLVDSKKAGPDSRINV